MKVWRELRNDEYPPPGPTKLGGLIVGGKSRTILVFAEPLPVTCPRCGARGDDASCRHDDPCLRGA